MGFCLFVSLFSETKGTFHGEMNFLFYFFHAFGERKAVGEREYVNTDNISIIQYMIHVSDIVG